MPNGVCGGKPRGVIEEPERLGPPGEYMGGARAARCGIWGVKGGS